MKGCEFEKHHHHGPFPHPWMKKHGHHNHHHHHDHHHKGPGHCHGKRHHGGGPKPWHFGPHHGQFGPHPGYFGPYPGHFGPHHHGHGPFPYHNKRCGPRMAQFDESHWKFLQELFKFGVQHNEGGQPICRGGADVSEDIRKRMAWLNLATPPPVKDKDDGPQPGPSKE